MDRHESKGLLSGSSFSANPAGFARGLSKGFHICCVREWLLRSIALHTGIPFHVWLVPFQIQGNAGKLRHNTALIMSGFSNTLHRCPLMLVQKERGAALMQMNKLAPNLMVEDVDKTLAFYKDTLGFELILGVPEEGPTDWAVMKCGNIEMMFQSSDSLVEEIPLLKNQQIGGALYFYIEVEDIEKLYAKLKGKASIVRDFRTTSYGMKEFLIQDCNGYLLAFAQEAGTQ